MTRLKTPFAAAMLLALVCAAARVPFARAAVDLGKECPNNLIKVRDAMAAT